MKRALCTFLGYLPLSAFATAVWIGDFNSPDATIPAPWRIERPNPQVPATRYRIRLWDGVHAVEAHAVNSMALLVRPVTVDLSRSPVLCWRWRIDAPLKRADMMQKSGDDYAARVYLSFDVAPERLGLGTRMGLALARSIHGDRVPDAAINYIWDNRHAVGTWQPNAYTERARMLVLRSGASEAGRWVEERRDVGADFQAAFGHAPLKLTGLAIATDTDNTGEEARAGFADFRFVANASECPSL
ncbi:MAG: DUF3047 domain-containing protein [Sulfuritalea sp.]|nr:DUF3047 domain-containing protein [Sulfuritalea sp.]MDP1983367.1 DUF3047 domain-containing protein [Sulfuritalea sp.]